MFLLWPECRLKCRSPKHDFYKDIDFMQLYATNKNNGFHLVGPLTPSSDNICLSLSLSHIGPRTALAKCSSSGLVEEFRGALQIDSMGATVWPAVGWSPMASCGTVRATPDGLRATKHAPRSWGSTFQGTGCGGWAGLAGRSFRVKFVVY